MQKEKDENKDRRLTEFEAIILSYKNDQDLWKFVTFNKETMFVSETNTKTKTVEESAVAKDWERVQRGRDSTNIPITVDEKGTYYYNELDILKNNFQKLSEGKIEIEDFWKRDEFSLFNIITKTIDNKDKFQSNNRAYLKLRVIIFSQ